MVTLRDSELLLRKKSTGLRTRNTILFCWIKGRDVQLSYLTKPKQDAAFICLFVCRDKCFCVYHLMEVPMPVHYPSKINPSI